MFNLNCTILWTLESLLDCKKIKLVHPKGNQSWIFIGRTDAEAETPILWLPDVKNSLIWKDPDAGRDWGQEEKGTPEDEMAGWHHWLDGSESEWTLGVGDKQGGLACCDSWVHKESDTIEQLNWTELMPYLVPFCYFCICCICLELFPKYHCQDQCQVAFSLCSSMSFMVSSLKHSNF